MKFGLPWVASFAASLVGVAAAHAAAPGTLVVQVDHPGASIGPRFFGLMTEEINHAYDGGLYAELIQNRIFRDDPAKPAHWSAVGHARIALDGADPVNDDALQTSLRVDLADAGPGNRGGVANDGFWGIPVWPNTRYHASFYARAGGGFAGPLKLSIESVDGKTVYAAGVLDSLTAGWGKYAVDLSTGAVPKTADARLVISAESKGAVWLSLVSLFPPTYHDRPNGNRIDLMEKLAALHPSFLRFPGGNFLEGNHVAERFDWKKTIGPLEQRPGHPGCWGYRASDGLGLLEFLEWCEDLHMQSLLAVYAGYSLSQDVVRPGPALQPFVQEALDEIEYCTGDATTPWGKQRVMDGHPQPFDIHCVEIGNEDNFDNSGTYDGRFTQFYDAIKKAYPQLQCIATTKVTTRTPDLYDDHSYPSVKSMLRMTSRYDDHDPKQPPVFFGEWATQEGSPTPTLRAALADAAWLTGLQRDAHTVLMNCYAPLLVNVNPGAAQWPTNLIGYNATDSFGSPSYWAQSMFAADWGQTVLPVTVTPQESSTQPAPTPHGSIGLATWRTSDEFKDLTVTAGQQTLFTTDFSKGVAGWYGVNGDWVLQNGTATQTNTQNRSSCALAGDTAWQDYTVHAKVRKLAGDEGFILIFHARDPEHYLSVNVGGYGNTQAFFEEIDGTARDAMGPAVPFNVKTGVWYDVRVDCHGTELSAFINDQPLLHTSQASAGSPGPLYAAASESGNAIILKVVNTAAAPQSLDVTLSGASNINPEATLTTLTGDPADMNSLAGAEKVVPQQTTLHSAGPRFNHVFPPFSVSVLRLQTHS